MDIFKQKFTRLQNEIFRLLCMKNGISLNQREIAKLLGVSPTAIAKSIGKLSEEGIIKIKKEGLINLTKIWLNTDNKLVIGLKRAENLKMIYESKITDFLEEKFPGSTIILFGSYSRGEDNISSDIDIAIVGAKEKGIDLKRFNKIFERIVTINFYPSFKEIDKNLRENIFNGIILFGGIKL